MQILRINLAGVLMGEVPCSNRDIRCGSGWRGKNSLGLSFCLDMTDLLRHIYVYFPRRDMANYWHRNRQRVERVRWKRWGRDKGQVSIDVTHTQCAPDTQNAHTHRRQFAFAIFTAPSLAFDCRFSRLAAHCIFHIFHFRFRLLPQKERRIAPFLPVPRFSALCAFISADCLPRFPPVACLFAD